MPFVYSLYCKLVYLADCLQLELKSIKLKPTMEVTVWAGNKSL